MEAIKVCRKCGLKAYTKEDLNEFVKDSKYKDGHTTICYACNRERNKEAREISKEYIKNKIKNYLNVKNNEYVCSKCKITSPYYKMFDWHHTNPSEKEFNIGNITRSAVSWVTLKQELDKCIFLCANCHRLEHI